MYFRIFVQYLKKHRHICSPTHTCFTFNSKQFYHEAPFISLYRKITGQSDVQDFIPKLEKRYPKLLRLSQEHLQCTIQTLSKFGITAEDACFSPHLFCMNPISMENYGDILKECHFTKILTKHIIRYHTLVKSQTISQIKRQGLLRDDLNLEELLSSHFSDWPRDYIKFMNFPDTSTNILTVRMSVLQRYLHYKFSISEEDFKKYCRNYLPLKHRPIMDIKEALHIARKEIQFDVEAIRRNGFIISSDPVNTKLILENVDSLGDLDIREAIRSEPAILKNHYQALLEIKSILQQFNISDEAQRRCLRVFCMRPDTVQARLEQLVKLKEYQVLSTNPRVLLLVVHERKMMNRVTKIQAAKKQCFSLNHLVSATKVFNVYINSFGNKVCGRDLGILISTSLNCGKSDKAVLDKLKRHKYWLHTALNVVGENIQTLKKMFDDDVIFDNCQILLYPGSELKQYIEFLNKYRDNANCIRNSDIKLDANYNFLNNKKLTDSQILSLVLYEIEKKYHFSGDGIWNKEDGGKYDTQTLAQKLKNSTY